MKRKSQILKKIKRKEPIWYLKTIDPATNEALAAELPEENIAYMPDVHGMTHKVWRCDTYETVQKFERAKKTYHFQFEVFRSVHNSEGKYIQKYVRPHHCTGITLLRHIHDLRMLRFL